MMDTFEEFEFKPITEGLGFHNKTASKTEVRQDSISNETSQQNVLPSIDPSPEARNILEKRVAKLPYDFANDKLFSQPVLPREGETKRENEIKKVQSPSIEIPRFNAPKYSRPLEARKSQNVIKQEVNLNAILDKIEIEEKEPAITPQAAATEHRAQLAPCAPSLLSMFLDFTVVAGLSILFTLALVLVTKIDMVPVLKGISTDVGSQIGLALMIYSVTQLYLILSRSFFGQTLGEWSMDTQIGTDEDQQKLSYIFRLIFRNFLLAVTGMILLPLLSLVLQKDLVGQLSGLKLYRK